MAVEAVQSSAIARAKCVFITARMSPRINRTTAARRGHEQTNSTILAGQYNVSR